MYDNLLSSCPLRLSCAFSSIRFLDPAKRLATVFFVFGAEPSWLQQRLSRRAVYHTRAAREMSPARLSGSSPPAFKSGRPAHDDDRKVHGPFARLEDCMLEVSAFSSESTCGSCGRRKLTGGGELTDILVGEAGKGRPVSEVRECRSAARFLWLHERALARGTRGAGDL